MTMFSCSACMERCLHGLIGNASATLSTPSVRTSVVTTTTSIIRKDYFARNYNTSSTSSASRPSRTPQYDSNSYYGRPRHDNDAPVAKPRKDDKLQPFKITRKEHQAEQRMGRVLSKYPVYGSDPLKLAEYIRQTLQEDNFDKALAVVRAASRGLTCIVSWNHLIDWQMSKGKMNAALKTYNEMKKRGQVPDSHTFTIIIMGCTKHRDVKAGLGQVLAIYHSMLLDKSPVKPNTIHLNAILKMCAKAGDMDAMFGVVASMPTKGVAAPNNLSLTTIINALRMDCMSDSRNRFTPMQRREYTRQVIIKGRHIWMDITKRWRQGDIWIDEELVCSMGRLMLLGEERDWDDILSLIEQSMNIPRQISRLDTKARSRVRPADQGRTERVGEVPAVSVAASGTSWETSIKDIASKDSLEVEPEQALTNVDNFKPFPLPTPPRGVLSAYAKPGRNSLSLVLAALDKLSLKGIAYRYWTIMVREFGVIPDAENYHAYLRILRKARASTETLELLQTMNRTEMRHSTFRIAISACERDKNNYHAFANAGKLLDIMTDALRVPDVPVLTSYLDTAVSPNTPMAPIDHGKRILRALDRLGPSMLNIKSLLIYGDPDVPMTAEERTTFQVSVLGLIRRMIAAYDICMNRALVPRNQYSELTQQRAKLTAYVTRYKAQIALKAVKESPYEEPTEIRTLPEHLMRYVDSHHLSKSMILAQKTDETWAKFVGDLETLYKLFQALQKPSSEPEHLPLFRLKSPAERFAEEEQRRLAEEEQRRAARRVGESPIERFAEEEQWRAARRVAESFRLAAM
ncbi:hypothetical protein HYFRA_00001332 [Hymenoscyphus fraxineus]|uniref:Pentatricopeptide repeat protein n=1 Tax=Hymenoscyphus fraxineus TaxID=746836 RepID=A0A9N9PMB3_9HELO|nr:hypothetical protein HYFRA_00001332 [Hymenoscyphus fraxineus]